MFHVSVFPEKSLNRSALISFIFTFFLITMHEIDTAAEVHLEPFQTYMIEIFWRKQLTAFRSSHPEVFGKKGVLRNFTKFTGKHLCQNLFFNKVAGLSPATLFKKRLWHRCFPVEFCGISKNTFLHRTPLNAASELLPLNSNISSIINWNGSKYASQPQRFQSRVFDIMMKMKLEHFLTQRSN